MMKLVLPLAKGKIAQLVSCKENEIQKTDEQEDTRHSKTIKRNWMPTEYKWVREGSDVAD